MAEAPTWIAQVGALPVRDGKVCLITTTSGKRWIIPKGLIDPGKSSSEMALQEAWEEAGLAGVLQPDPLGTNLYEKYGGTCHVTVYLMNVTETADEWPEHEQREREWVNPQVAMERLADEGLREILRRALARDGERARTGDAAG